MSLTNPFDVFLLAFLAAIGWTLGASLMQSAASQVNLYLIGRTTKRQAEKALEHINRGVAEIQKAAAASKAVAAEAAALADRERKMFPVLGDPGRS